MQLPFGGLPDMAVFGDLCSFTAYVLAIYREWWHWQYLWGRSPFGIIVCTVYTSQ